MKSTQKTRSLYLIRLIKETDPIDMPLVDTGENFFNGGLIWYWQKKQNQKKIGPKKLSLTGFPLEWIFSTPMENGPNDFKTGQLFFENASFDSENTLYQVRIVYTRCEWDL